MVIQIKFSLKRPRRPCVVGAKDWTQSINKILMWRVHHTQLAEKRIQIGNSVAIPVEHELQTEFAVISELQSNLLLKARNAALFSAHK